MGGFVIASLLVNIAVLIPVCASLVTNAKWTGPAFGPPTAARGILLSIYFAILACSAILILVGQPLLVVPLLAVQIIYKFTTPLTVGTVRNPVVLSNIAIAALHCVTLATLWLGSPSH